MTPDATDLVSARAAIAAGRARSAELLQRSQADSADGLPRATPSSAASTGPRDVAAFVDAQQRPARRCRRWPASPSA